MKKRDWFLVIGLVPAIWLLDQASKAWAIKSISQFHFYGPVGFILHYNPGAILGTFSDLPPLLRVVSLSTGGAFLVSIYAAIQYLVPSRSLQLRIGMSLLLGGILGNVTDRILSGAVTDFIVLGVQNLTSPAFNVADAIQWVGYFFVVYGLVRDGNLFWPDSNVRKTIWVNPRFQLKYILTLVVIGACFSVINGVFTYTFLRMTIDSLVAGPPRQTESRFLIPFLQTYFIISTGFMLALFAVARILSHRTAGPVYAFEIFVRDLLSGKDRKFRVRSGDDFKNLEELADYLRPILIRHMKESEPSPEPENKSA